MTRETVLIDRRAPALRWSAVFAGTACSVGFWMLLQLIGVGIGLASVDVDRVESLRTASIGTSLWSLLSPLIAMFLGGLIAGRLAQTGSRTLAGAHGLVMWALTSILGLCATIWIVALIAGSAGRGSVVAIDSTGRMAPIAVDTDRAAPDDAGRLPFDAVNAVDVLGPINQRLSSQGKPTITPAQLQASMRGMVRNGIARGDFDQDLLADQLVAHTRLSRADAADVERQLEAQLGNGQPHGLEHRAEHRALAAADAAGKALAIAGLSLLLSLVAAIAGAVLALHRPRRRGEGHHPMRSGTEPGFAPPVEPAPPVAGEAPTPTAGPATPVIPPRDVTP